ncbi:DedA family protein [Salinibacterium sp. SYSU T00001]|uniref:DedA family protein n=1 Tax=Homoserinimonas sedimenticola TaxID=2986805 RepID=UPI00223695B9|nr:DedA family protein [Salinibacterium sedimenticola]MCW4384966.1 DedA family protein [Salinibacterium sedimenticola]
MMTALQAEGESATDLGGLVGAAATVLETLGEVGVGVLTLVETVFPPIPSEVVLPLAGFLAQQGRMNFVFVLIAATAGGYLGALALYALGRRIGEERSIRLLSKLPLVDREDFEKASRWFQRHGRPAVFFGRLLPGVRSLISLPAGAEKMGVASFSLFTIAGTALWNGLLVGLGALLGTQYQLIDQYSWVLDAAVVAALVGVVGWLVIRRIRRRRAQQGD